ncbi:nucleotide exchange factor GrpE [Thalassobacter stenotrophicus]|jgi:molecular chaperone GrpE|uniref:Protein GrpE n=2 Tax=Thalassobacter stenotrophicus TaxID=266809 RepID=A0A0P1EZG7_9RHOB|nr:MULTISPECIES: nucleotide exchange factor GrpE [Thalassobacter]KGK78649.1 molecular chaperone GrpE [Thalassobacter stenotrophicus]KGL00623.1 molecular chaperone GrpE [Thalassobacter sp. 16PALIMAR09]PVZ49542.1 nucleotide exchange factor GrpE [Thalassobacter stenotrophicus]UYP67712.1 nucleotide exchange factor GrpE [Thalassobacter stenotrophicus]CUH60590.1 HSP-70 cofactor [Thalassobacter stenotrophicus]
MAEPREEPFLDDPEAVEEDFDLDAAMAEGPKEPGPNVDAIIAERDDYKDRFMRALADAENLRKRSERDRREAEQYGGSKLARDMMPVYDNLKRALDAAGDEVGGVIEGIQLTLKELSNVFEKHGITILSPEMGEKFDPQMHQAMFEAPVPGTKAGDIIQVMAEGFMLHDRLLRPAQVGVSSTPAG